MKKFFRRVPILVISILVCVFSLSIAALKLPSQSGKTGSIISKILNSQNGIGSQSLESIISGASKKAPVSSKPDSGSNSGRSSGKSSASNAGTAVGKTPASNAGKTPASSLSSNSAVSSRSALPSAKSSVSSSVSSSYFPSAAAPKFSSPEKIIVGYYGGWAAYSGVTPDKLNVSQLNVLNYAFAEIDGNLKIAMGDPAVDLSNFSRLQSVKNSHSGLKTVISVGGWSYSGKFSDAALTESSRAVFADSVVDFIKTYGFDGVDIDWEYPTGGGLSGNTVRAEDKTNFGLLLKTLRAKLDAQGIKDGKHYILSFAGGASSSYARGVGLSNIANTVDYGYIMTYDFHGPWDSFTDFNAPLYSPSGTSPQYKASVSEAVSTWISCGFPASKMVLGVPFYGYLYKGTANANNGLWQRYGSAAAVGFDQICSNYLSNPAFARHYDNTAQVPFIFDGSNFICYDDQNSIGLKAQYAMSRGLYGVGAWDLSYDRNGILIGAIKNAIK